MQEADYYKLVSLYDMQVVGSTYEWVCAHIEDSSPRELHAGVSCHILSKFGFLPFVKMGIINLGQEMVRQKSLP